jgi:hypothetical protein
MNPILLIVLIIVLIAVLPTWPYSRSWGSPFKVVLLPFSLFE